MEQVIQPIEGITPAGIWNALYVIVALAGIVILGDKLVDVFRRRKERKEKEKRELQRQNEQPVETLEQRLAAIEERLTSIDTKLAADKHRLEALERQQDRTDDGFRAMCKATLAILNKLLHDGNNDEMEAAQKDLQDYLIKK